MSFELNGERYFTESGARFAHLSRAAFLADSARVIRPIVARNFP